MKRSFVILFSIFSFSLLARAQKNEVGLLLGGSLGKSPGVTATASRLDIGAGLAFQATYARWLTQRDRVAVGIEVPLVALPSQDVTSNLAGVPRNYASLFITPGVRLKAAPRSRISPWASVGGGYARFDESTTLVSGAANTFPKGTNKGALQFGGGVDIAFSVKILVPLRWRLEVRDFFSGQPRLNAARTDSGQHNVVASGGFVVSF